MEQQELFAAQTQRRMEEFLTHWIAIEEEQEVLREQQRALREEYGEWFCVRALRTAIKVIRARRTLADHPKEPVPVIAQARFEQLVEQYLLQREAEREATQREAERVARVG